MKWIKKGFICSHETFDLDWFKKNTMVPLPYLIDDKTIRIYITMCDEKNIGRIGFVDVEADNPSKIVGYSKKPVIDIGIDGTFDDNGVVTASLLKDDDKLYMFYSGYQLCTKVPYLIFTGLAVSHDNGYTFEKLTTEIPLLDRIKGEVANRCVPFVIKEGDTYKMWYTASVGDGWCKAPNGKLEPLYNLKYMESKDLLNWQNIKSQTVIDFKNEDEHGICKSVLWKEDGLYKIIYSLRHLSKGYRLGYGESKDGINWTRMDDKVGITISDKPAWDDDMVCFAERLEYKDKVYLFYSGNHYGMQGIGYAELEEE